MGSSVVGDLVGTGLGFAVDGLTVGFSLAAGLDRKIDPGTFPVAVLGAWASAGCFVGRSVGFLVDSH